MARGTGITTNQMKSAPQNAVFVWCHGALWYPKQLARSIGREDLEIVSPEWLISEKWVGKRLTGLVIDHAFNEHYRHHPVKYIEAIGRIENMIRIYNND